MSAKRNRNRAVDMQQAQQRAMAFAQEWLSSNALGLGELDEQHFAETMNAITRGLVQAYAKGYVDGVEQQ